MQIAPPASDAPAPSRRSRTLSSFRHPDYRYLLVGAIGSQMGDWIQTVGQGWLILVLTRSAAELGIFGFVRGAAILLITPALVGMAYSARALASDLSPARWAWR